VSHPWDEDTGYIAITDAIVLKQLLDRFRASQEAEGYEHPPETGLKGSSQVKHQRIRTFNTKDTYPEQNLDNDLCQAVVANGVVYLRGQIGQDLETRESVGIGDVEAQTEKAMANIDMLLKEAGSSLEDIVKVTVYLVDPRYRETVYRTMGRWLKGVFPVSTGIVVQALARPEWLVEIDATAVLSAEGQA
jgi:enamine deaminase RidA (YjgF/YER057c/UK114 family)